MNVGQIQNGVDFAVGLDFVLMSIKFINPINYERWTDSEWR